MLEAGTYRARALQAALTEAKTGNKQIAVDMQVHEGPHRGETIKFYGTFTEKAFPITHKALRAMGFIGDDLEDLSSLKNSEVVCDIVVKHEFYNGEWRAKCAYVNPAGSTGAATKPLVGAELKGFAAQMKNMFKAQDALNPEDGEPPPF